MNARFAGVCCVAVLTMAAVASADEIKAGQVTGQTFSLSGDGFDLTGRLDTTQISCAPCQAGQDISFMLLPEVRFFSGTVNGVTYPLLTTGSVIQKISVLNLFSTGGVTIPADPNGNLTLTFPFRTGAEDVLFGYVGSESDPTVTLPLSGTGIATVTLHFDGTTGSGNPIYDGAPTWTFGSAASPTPEPISLVLLGSGLAGMALRRRSLRPQE